MKRAAKAVTPYSGVGETGANVPALKHFFRCLETTGTALTDSKGGCVLDVPSLVFNAQNSSNTVAPRGILVASDPVPLTTGTFHTFDPTKTVMFLVAARKIVAEGADADQPRFALGDVNDRLGYANPAGLSVSNSAKFHTTAGDAGGANQWRAITDPAFPGDAVYDSNTGLPLTALNGNFNLVDPTNSASAAGDGQDIFVLLVHEPSGTKLGAAYDITTQTKWMYGWTTTSDTLTQAWQPNPCMRITQLAVYGAAVFEFTTRPSDYLLASTWMAQEWKRGNRVIWPGWIGVN